mmetsp:Transcript_22862/g.75808  ORF Transcript_22862/g.75808 Transcript_22862/m.75808 type:complete len:240 (+) Transcript_22862:386-1105(+)
MERELGKVETVIAAETRRRIEASKALQVMFESQLEKLQVEFKESLRESYEPLQAQIDALVARVETIEATLVEEKRDRELAVQRANRDVVDNFAEHVKQFDVEKVVRLQREAQTLKRVGDEVYRVQQKVTAERTAREAAIVLMKDDFAAALEVRDKADEVFKAEVFRKAARRRHPFCTHSSRASSPALTPDFSRQKVATVESALGVETNARLASEEQLVAALNDYTTALQDGLKIVHRAQ